jgi:Flp pilus assembly protein TadG
MKFLKWLTAATSHVSRAQRYRSSVVAHYWDGGAAAARCVRDISITGAYIVTAERWYLGTILNLTIQCQPNGTDSPEQPESVTVPCKVVRHGPDGMGVAFVFTSSHDRKKMQNFLKRLPPHNSSASVQASEGQALIEFALMVPLLFLLIFNAVNFGGFLYSWVTISNAARAGGQYAAMGAAYASYPTAATLNGIQTLIQNETSSLPGASTTNPYITVCEVQNGGAPVSYPPTNPTTACSSTAPPQDLETISELPGASKYTTVFIDVTYTYTPFIGAFSSGLVGIVSPPTTVHRRTVMRLLN